MRGATSLATACSAGPVSAADRLLKREFTRESRTPDKALTARILAAALERGLVLLSAGTFGNVIRVLAPLTADDAVIDEGLDVMGAALEAAVGRAPALA